MFHDAHNHLQDPWLRPHLPMLAEQLPKIGVKAAVVNGTCESDWPEVAALGRRFSWVRASFGLHPWHAGNRSASWLEGLTAALAADPSAAVGEIGIDQWMLRDARADDPRLVGLRRASLEEQVEVFRLQWELAVRLRRTPTVHCLHAWGTLDPLLRTFPRPDRGFLLHAYAGPREMIGRLADAGAYFSFNGSFLDPRRKARGGAFRHVPADRLLVETDAPAMIPPPESRPYQLPDAEGSPVNHPGNIQAAYAGLATLRGLAPEELAQQVGANFTRLFG